MKEDKEIINSGSVEQQSLIKDLRQIIEQARGHVAATANYELTLRNNCKRRMVRRGLRKVL